MKRLKPRYLDTRQAAAYLDLGPRTLRRMRAAGEGPPYARWGRRVIYDRADLDEWMARHKRGLPPEGTDGSDSSDDPEPAEEPDSTDGPDEGGD